MQRVHNSVSIVVILELLCFWLPLSRADESSGLISYWKFDEVQQVSSDAEPQQNVTFEAISGFNSRVRGFYRTVPGVRGEALRLGGINSLVEGNSEASLFAGDSFSVEAWIALGAYPVHWCPIVAEANDTQGVVFGIDADGHLGLEVAIDGAWQSVVSQGSIALNEWTHVACAFQANGKMAIYIDGKLVGSKAVGGQPSLADSATLLIGKHPVARQPFGTLRPHATEVSHTYFDGILDELKIHNRHLNATEIAAAFNELKPTSPPQLPQRHLPTGSVGPTAFGASYATLKYYDAWDAEWPVGDSADVVVTFDNNQSRLVFWRGTSYIPHWVTENGVWYNNEFVETWSDKGCHEPMSDKHCRYSNVRILESSPARVVVQWRYALTDNWYFIFRQDEPHSMGEWVEETYTIYPDAIGVRKIVLYSPNPNGAPHEWNEAIVVMGPGQKPEDALNPDAVTLASPDGQSQVFSWAKGAPAQPESPSKATIELINTKSRYKPFLAVPASSQPVFDIYAGEQRPEISMFPWWNHWPTAFDPCDGRYAMAADRASHSSLTHCTWDAYEQTDRSMTKIMLQGLTDQPIVALAKLVRSWDSAPTLEVTSEGITSNGYDPTQRAYILKSKSDAVPSRVSFQVAASEASPIENLAIFVEGWGQRKASVEINGEKTAAKVGYRHTLDGSDLILWLESSSNSPLAITLISN